MRKGRCRRLGLFLLAVAFLVGGLLGTANGPADHHDHAGPAHVQAMAVQAMAAQAMGVHAMADPAPLQTPAQGKASDCRHGGDCLLCAAVLIPVTPGPIARLQPEAVTFRPMVTRLSGVSTRPELFPPIRQA